MRKNILLIIFTLTVSIMAKAQDITGIIMDTENDPIIGAHIFFASKPDGGAISDMNGRFSISFTHSTDTLIASFIGYESKIISASKLKQDAENTIVLKTEALSIGEVVVLGATPVSEQFSTEQLSSLDIYMNPISQADPLKAIIRICLNLFNYLFY